MRRSLQTSSVSSRALDEQAEDSWSRTRVGSVNKALACAFDFQGPPSCVTIGLAGWTLTQPIRSTSASAGMQD